MMHAKHMMKEKDMMMKKEMKKKGKKKGKK